MDQWQHDGSANVYEPTADTMPDFISFTPGASGCDIDVNTCIIVRSSSSTCTSTQFTGFYAAVTGTYPQTVQLQIQTQNPIMQQYFCLSCNTNDPGFTDIMSQPFQMQVKGCVSYISMASIVGSPFSWDIPSSPAGSNTQVFSGPSYFVTTDTSNCALTITLYIDSSTYSGSGLSMTSDGTLSVDTNTIQSGTYKIRVRAGQSNGFDQYTDTFTVAVGCSSTYTISEGSSTNPQYVSQLSSSVGFDLPTYTVSNPSCAVARSTSSTTGSYTAHTTLDQPINSVGSTYQVQPTTYSTHLKYTFYTRVVVGATTEYYGPYYLDVGCTSTAVSVADSTSLDTAATTLNVGSSTSNFWYFNYPTTGRSYCSAISNYIRENDGTTDSTKAVENGGSQPENYFNLVSTATAETFSFKIFTTITGSLVTHTSASISMIIQCASSTNYYVRSNSSPTQTQRITHLDSNAGFLLSTYYTELSNGVDTPGCPITGIYVRSCNGCSGTVSGLDTSYTLYNGNNYIQPSTLLHTYKDFYIRVEGGAGDYTYWGQYRLWVGCNSNYISHSNSGYTSSLTKYVGDSVTGVYSFVNPYANQVGSYPWCTPQTNIITFTNNNVWTGTVRLIGSGSQPYTTWDMNSLSGAPETIYFRIRTEFPGTPQYQYSGTITIYVYCHTSSYTLSEGTYYNSLTSTQYVAHGSSSTTGFYLPPYTSSQQTGCPAVAPTGYRPWTSSACNSYQNSPYMYTPTSNSGYYIARPSSYNNHDSMLNFYVKVQKHSYSSAASNYQCMGPYKLYVGCQSSSVTFSDDAGLVTTKARYIGDNLSGAYTFLNPSATRTWCVITANTYVSQSGSLTLTGSGSAPTSWSLSSTASAGTFTFYIRTTFTNSMTHNSATVSMSVACGNAYGIIPDAAPTNPVYQNVGLTTGFDLPTFATYTYEAQCPVDTWEISSSDSSIVAPTGLNNPALASGIRTVKASTQASHLKYTFYAKISASGGSYFFFGPYYLDVGCTATAMTITAGTSFTTTTVTTNVGAAGTGIYTFDPPTNDLSYCAVIKSEAVDSDGSTISTKISCVTQPCTSFDFVSTTGVPETVTFKILTTFTGSANTYVQGPMTVILQCASTLTFSEVASPTNPQFVTHGSSTVGFVLPSYQSTQNTGCPPNQFQLSTVNSGLTSPGNLNAPTTISASEVVVPTTNSLHQAYTFYLKVSETLGGSSQYLGSYTVNVGCFSGSVAYSDNGGLVTSVAKWVGDSTVGVYTFLAPTSTRTWCVTVSNAILTSAGAAWSGAAKLTPTDSQPYLAYDLVSTTNPETVSFIIQTTFTNSMLHNSAVVSIAITCNNNYAITESTATNGVSPQYKTHGATTLGFQLGVYTSAQETGCPVNTWEVTNAGSGAVSTPAGLPANPSGSANALQVIPTNDAAHQAYTFYIKATASLGVSNAYFGPYTVNIGCFVGSVTFADATNFVTSVNLLVGDSTSNIYTLNVPTSTRSWCVIATNQIVDATDGVTLFSTKLNQCSGAACNVYSLISTSVEEVINFKVLTTWTNGLTHASAQATITITCGSAYTVTEVSSPTNPQYISHGVASLGFDLPTYQSSQNVGCPIDYWYVTSSSSGTVNIPAGLNEQVLQSAVHVVKPSDNTQHLKYTFYTKIVARGGSFAYFGPYYVDVGCTITSVTYTDSPSFVTDVPLWVGDSGANVYTLAVPTSTRAWCQIVSHEIVDTDGSTYSGPVRFASPFGCATSPCTASEIVFSLAATTYPEVINFAIKTTFTNLDHLSAATKFTITCNSVYVVSATSHTSPQYVTHLGGVSTTEGFTLPIYTSAQNTGCPIDTWEITNVGSGSVVSVTNMPATPVVDGSDREARPSDGTLHAKYTFYIKATASDGLSKGYFGPYILYVGCTSESVTFGDNASIITFQNLAVGSGLTSNYQFYQPTSTRTWCVNLDNQVVNNDVSGSSWTGTTKLTPVTPQPATQNDIYQATTTEIFTFKIKSTMTNNLIHLGPKVVYTIYCANTYTITEVAAQTNPQFVSHADSSQGFLLPSYTNPQQTGCPDTNWEVSTSNTAVVSHSGLNEPVLLSGERKVKPTDNTLHQGYFFYLKVSANRTYLNLGDSTAYFGLYEVRVGCYEDSLTFIDSVSFIPTVELFVGDSTSNVYTMHAPTRSRTWCLLLTNEFATDQSQPWSSTVKFGTDSANVQPYSSFNLVSTTMPEVIRFRMKSTYTNTQIHYSPIGEIIIICNNNYQFIQTSQVTNPLYVQHNDGDNTGFIIPSFQTSQNAGCPVSIIQTTKSNVFMDSPSNLLDPRQISSQMVIQPSDLNAHKLYLFYIRITAVGGSVGYFGSYNLVVGCTSSSLVSTDNSTFITNVPMSVGEETTGVYVFYPPTSSKTYCLPQNYEIVDQFGNEWLGKQKLKPTANCTSIVETIDKTTYPYTTSIKHNCTIFDLVDSSLPDYIQFKVKTYYLNNMVHYSPLASISLAELFQFTSAGDALASRSTTNPAANKHDFSHVTNNNLGQNDNNQKTGEDVYHDVNKKLDYSGKVVGGIIVGAILSAAGVAAVQFIGSASAAAVASKDAATISKLRSSVQPTTDIFKESVDNTLTQFTKNVDDPQMFNVEENMQCDPRKEFEQQNNENHSCDSHSCDSESACEYLHEIEQVNVDKDYGWEKEIELERMETIKIEKIELERMQSIKNETIMTDQLNASMNDMAEDIQIHDAYNN